MSAVCSSCGASILWAVSERGKRMPLDATPVATVQPPAGSFQVDADGVAYSARRPIDFYVSHFATCEFADQHRRPS